MKVSKADKKRKAVNILAEIFDCDYMIRRLQAINANESEINEWNQHRKDLVILLSKSESK